MTDEPHPQLDETGRLVTRRRVLRLVFEIGALALGVHLLIPQLAGSRRPGSSLRARPGGSRSW